MRRRGDDNINIILKRWVVRIRGWLKLASDINPLNVQLNPICHLLALLGAHPILHVSRIKVKW
jgi:hypothetical protein